MRGAGPVGGGTVEFEADGKGTVGTEIAVGDAGVGREGAPDGAENQVLVVTEGVFGKNERSVAGHVGGLRELE